MEQKATREGLTGDPNEGGYFGYSQKLADKRYADMEGERKASADTTAAKRSQIAVLKRKIEQLKAELNAAATEEACATLTKQIQQTQAELDLVLTL
jgi:hypothetical protein